MKNAILLAATGSSDSEAIRTLTDIKKRVEKQFSSYSVEWVFTSNYIRDKLPKNSIGKKSLEQYLEKMKSGEINIKAIQSFHISISNNYNDLKNAIARSGLNIKLGKPLLSTKRNYKKITEIFSKAIFENRKDNSQFLILAHGDENNISEPYLKTFEKQVSQKHKNVHILTLHGKRCFSDYLKNIKFIENGNCTIMPFMITSGKHVKNEFMGSHEKSLKSILLKMGQIPNFLDASLGNNSEALDIWIKSLIEMIETTNV